MNLKKLIYLFLFGFAIWANVEPLRADPPRKPFPPFHIIGNIYYVGDSFQADYLVVTDKGNILINSGYEADIPMLKENIKKLGFKFSDTKILLINHAHNDHGGGAAVIQKETGATYMVMEADVPVVESGGDADFQYGKSKDPDNHYQSAKVNKVLHDGDQVRLGNATLVAHLTPGHTKGCTTWTMNVMEKGKNYHVVIVGGPYVNPGYQLVHNHEYPSIAQDYQRGFNLLKSLPCDVFLGAHGLYFDFERKSALINQGKENPFVDPEGYEKFVSSKEQDFISELSKQKAAG